MTDFDPALWWSILAYLRRHHAQLCRQWFEELEPLSFDSGVLTIRAADPVKRNYLARTCAEAFNDAAQSETGALVAVRFVAGEAAARPNGRSGHAAASAPVAADDPMFDDQIALSPDYALDNFVTGPGNHLAYAATVAVVDQPGQAYNPLFIHGGVGLGKTHLLQAAAQAVLQKSPDTRILYLSCDSFINQFHESVSGGGMYEFRHRYRHVDMLMIDDIHFLADAERTQEEFFHTFNTLYQANKQIVLSSDSPPNQIPALEERLVSRFNWGLVARIDKPCYETRVAIVKKKTAIRGLKLPDDVVNHIAARIESNTRELEGAINQIQTYAHVHGLPIDLPLAEQALGNEPNGHAAPQLPIQTIIDTVTAYYNIKVSDVQGKRRHRSVTVPRQVCMYLARKRTGHSLEEIGGYFGGRDHTTVMHAIRTIGERLDADADFAAQVNQLDNQLAPAAGGRRPH